MRAKRTRDEVAAISQVTASLREAGHSVVEDLTFTDRPDWVFELDGRRIAADCSSVTLEQLMKWAKSKRQLVPGRCYKITFPVEPHLWIKRLLESKSSKVGHYLARARAQEAWLIAHSDFEPGFSFFESTAERLQLMRDAAAALVTQFDCVWFVHGESGAHRLWRRGDALQPFPSLAVADQYPTQTIKQGIGTVSVAGGMFSAGDENVIQSILLQPLDTRYKLQQPPNLM